MADDSPPSPVAPLRERLNRGWYEVRWYLRQMVEQFLAHDCLASAGTLTYTTLFAIVPLMTVAYIGFSLLPQADQVSVLVQDYVFDNFMPASGELVQEKLFEFSENAKDLTLISALFLFVTTFMMLMNIEKTFNRVWHVPEARTGMQRLLVYWSVLTLAPLFFIAAGGIGLYFMDLPFLSRFNAFGAGEWLLSQLPKLLVAVAFTVIYYAVPNCEVPLKHAVGGGVLTMVVFMLVVWMFRELAPGLAFNAIYGAFAAVPIFLAWIYLVWVIVLAGLIFVRCLSLQRDEAATPEPLIVKAARVMRLLNEAHEEGASVSDQDIRRIVPLNRAEHERVFGVLRELRVLHQGEHERWLLSRNLRTLTLWDLYQALPEGIDDQTLAPISDLPGVVDPIRSIHRFGSNEMSVTLDLALGGRA